MAVGIGNRVVAKETFHEMKKHEETFTSNLIPLWGP